MALEGRLGKSGAGDLLAALWRQGRTGILELHAAGKDRRLVLSGGEIVYVTSSETAEKLPVRLVTRGLVDKASLVRASQAGADLRRALADAGALAADDHDRELRALIGDVVEDLFGCVDGTYAFVDKPELQLPGMLEANPMGPILWRAAQRCPPELAEAFLGDRAQRVTRAATDAALEQLTDISPQQVYLATRIDGYSSLGDVLGASPLPPEETYRTLVGLTLIGLIDVVGRPAVQLPRPGRSSGARPRATVTAAGKASTGPATPAIPIATASGASATVAETPGEGLPPLERARELASRAAELDHFRLLDVSQSASDSEVRKAYYALAKTFHPDRFPKDLPASDRALVEDLFSRIGEAFAVLSDGQARAEYVEKLKSGEIEREKTQEDVDPRQIARESHAKGCTLIAGGDRGRGLPFLQHAVDVDPKNYEFRLTLAKVLMTDSRTRKRAERQLVEATRIEPSNPEAYYRLGLIYRAANLKSRALEQFRKGLEWDPSHAGILAEVEKLEGGDDSSTGGLLGGIFGKKK